MAKHAERGSTLMVTLFMVGLLGFFLFAYLYLVRTQRSFVTRSQAWNGALGMAEAGVEEALAQLNPGAPEPNIDRTANGWGAAANGIYGPKSRTLTNNGSYSVVYTTDTFPTIYSTGYVSVPSIPAVLKRTVRVTTTTMGLFIGAMIAEGNIDLKGNNVATDSFNSAVPGLNTNGYYNPSMIRSNGDIASFSGVVNVGNADIRGSVLLGPTASDAIQKNGYITGGVSNDFNVNFENVVLPSTSPIPASNPLLPFVFNGVTYDYAFLLGGYYSINNLKNQNIYVAPGVSVTLLLTGNATANVIYVDGAGLTSGKLTIYMDGPSFTLSGNETVNSGNAANLSYYGTTNNTSITFSGNSSFTGTIYAPQADFSLGGSGGSTYDFVGASVTKTVTMNGHFNFHYDENLAANGPQRGYVAASWTEL